jgi:hypothetical protein
MDIFNRGNVYDTIFFNIQSVTEYGDIKDFESAEPEKYQTWLRMAKKRYKEEFEKIDQDNNLFHRITNELYLEKACFLPEFSKIVAISYATASAGADGKLKRDLKRIEGTTELELIKEFCTMLTVAHTVNHDAKKSPYTLCGHNIIGHDIPLLTKRIIKYRNELKGMYGDHIVPMLIKDYLNAKPWNSNVIDTINVWKFNGTDFISLNLISDFLGLKKTVRLKPKDEINKLYWVGIEDDEGSTMNEINTQCANFTNVAFQILNEIRTL